MKCSRYPASFAIIVVSLLLGSPVASGTVAAASPVGAGIAPDRSIVIAASAATYPTMKAEIIRSGARIVLELPATNAIVIAAGSPNATVAALAASPSVMGIGADKVRRIVPPEMAGTQPLATPRGAALQPSVPAWRRLPDPAFSMPGLMWNIDRINAPAAWSRTIGRPNVLVGVADTGVDYTHSELASQVVDVAVFTDPTLCKENTGYSDADLAAMYGGPTDTDWNGHGSWIGGNIAAAADGVGVNGIAPGVKLVALKIAEWCGYTYDSSILGAFEYAADHGVNIVSISFGGYADRANPDEELLYQQYVSMVAYARSRGTVIVASAGNEHARIGVGGLVLSHGTLTNPGGSVTDLYGLYEVPGGLPGVVDVSATGNVVEAPSASCPAGTADNYNATCKPSSDLHRPYGVGRRNALAYYSNYGPRIDIAAPGGARKFNLPGADRGGTGGWPVTSADGTTAYESFSTTSNWAMSIPCYFDLPGFYPGECYSTIQGTSMAAPEVSGVLALIASAKPAIAHNPAALVAAMKLSATRLWGNNPTPPLSATDTSPGDLTGVPCPTGYCHLGGSPIPDAEAYGAGLVNAAPNLR